MTPDNETPDEASSTSELSEISDAVGDLIAGVPAPVRKNAAKAFSRLCSAIVDYPVAVIEGAIAERRAATGARIKLIEASAKQIAQQLKVDPEYAVAASEKFAQKIIRERANVDQIAAKAKVELEAGLTGQGEKIAPSAEDISDNWLNAFEDEAGRMSSELMQRTFAKILAGEVARPSSFSVRTVKLVSQLDNEAARVFVVLCSLAVAFGPPGHLNSARVVGLGNAGANSLAKYGLSFDALNMLQEYGLIIADYNSYADFRFAVAYKNRVASPFLYAGTRWGLVPNDEGSTGREFRVHGVALTTCGVELLQIVDTEPNAEYSGALRQFLDKSGYTLAPVNVG
jgi:hypothetical protein